MPSIAAIDDRDKTDQQHQESVVFVRVARTVSVSGAMMAGSNSEKSATLIPSALKEATEPFFQVDVMQNLAYRLLVASVFLTLPGFASAARPGFGFRLNGLGVELKLLQEIPNTAKNPIRTRKYEATVKQGSTFVLDVGQYLMGGGLPKPQRVAIAAATGEWQHDTSVSATPSKLKDKKFTQAGPTTTFTALKQGKKRLIFELDDRPNEKRKNLSSPTHVVWRFEVELFVE